jgi:hypothetical protein
MLLLVPVLPAASGRAVPTAVPTALSAGAMRSMCDRAGDVRCADACGALHAAAAMVISRTLPRKIFGVCVTHRFLAV